MTKEVAVKRFCVCVLIGFSCLCLSLLACSKKEEAEPEKGAIEKMTDEAADVIVNKIRTPMDRARSVEDLQQDRAKAMEEALDEKE
jgi:hypothetical protein